MSVEELDRIVADVQATAMPEFLEDGAVRIHAMVYERGSLVAAAFHNYRNRLLEGE